MDQVLPDTVLCSFVVLLMLIISRLACLYLPQHRLMHTVWTASLAVEQLVRCCVLHCACQDLLQTRYSPRLCHI